MKEYCIYCHINKINRKRYVGQTCQQPKRRWNSGYGYKKNFYFYNAIQKYGWHNFQHIILETGLTYQQANERERYYIKKFDTTNSTKGYNIAEGGFSLAAYYEKEENCKKQSKIRKEYFETHPEEKEKAIQLLTKISRETAKQRSQKMAQNYKNGGGLYEINQKRKKRVCCVQTGRVFESLTQASRIYNVSISSLSAVINGKKETVKGYHWKRVENE